MRSSKSRQNKQTFQALLEEMQNENAGLRAALSELSQQALQNKDAEVVALPVNPEQSLVKIKRLQAENLRLEELVEKLLAGSEAQPNVTKHRTTRRRVAFDT